MAKPVKKVVKKQVKKKRWVPILAPAFFNKQKVGEAHTVEAQDMVGRKVAVSMMALTGDPRRQNVTAKLTITSTEGDSLATEFIGFRTLPSEQRKLVRRNREKLADSFVLKTKDNKLIRIKPLCVTRGKSTRGTLTTMRKLIRAHLAQKVAGMTFEALVQGIVQKKIQQELQATLRKLHPMQACDIRELILVPEEKRKFIERLVLNPAAAQEAAEEAVEEAEA